MDSGKNFQFDTEQKPLNSPAIENDELMAQVDDFFDKQQFYGFRIGEIGLLISGGIESEILDNFTIHPVPNTVSWLRGVINLRGHLVPVYNLHELFGFSQNIQKHSFLIILDKGENSVAIEISDYPKVLENLVQVDRQLSLPEVFEDYVLEIYEDEGVSWLSFNKQQFFSALSEKIVATK
ncbi:MAG: chemotaxis protein CheW [Proteobacteria bacterium]|nr:chemotaxis protein CheW [Pseudomonadota bacterium]